METVASVEIYFYAVCIWKRADVHEKGKLTIISPLVMGK